ncbi:hypothetical protein [Ferruginibacter sp.]
MQQPSPLFNFITKENHSGVPAKDFLAAVTKQHPYFAAAHFYLLQQIKPGDAGYDLQAAKTAILFNNPHWLNFQLQKPASVSQEITTEILPAENEGNDDDNAITAIIISSTQEKSIEPPETVSPTAEQLMLAENADNDDDETITEKEIAPIKININIPEVNTSNADALTFEPMHLVDYFASQGIKLSEEVQPTDKLGMQLKSFTGWLKTMKKIHVADTQASAGIADMVIQTLAAKSNTEGEVLTEAMAEVLLQQGKTEKAAELYKKLSLLNPSKIAYFAAKIEQLKG